MSKHQIYSHHNGGDPARRYGWLELVDLEPIDVSAVATTGFQIDEDDRRLYLYQVSNTTDVNDILILPDAPVGSRIWLYAVEGFELRSHDPATVGLNGGTGATAESAVAAGMFVELKRTTATNWIGRTTTAAGVDAALQVAA